MLRVRPPRWDPGRVWSVLIGAGFVFELWALATDHKGDTLSERLRVWARIHTPAGRWGFVLSWAALTAWFLPHILADPNRDQPPGPGSGRGTARGAGFRMGVVGRYGATGHSNATNSRDSGQ